MMTNANDHGQKTTLAIARRPRAREEPEKESAVDHRHQLKDPKSPLRARPAADSLGLGGSMLRVSVMRSSIDYWGIIVNDLCTSRGGPTSRRMT